MSLVLLPVVLIRREYLIIKEMLLFFAVYGLIRGLLELAMFGGIALGVKFTIYHNVTHLGLVIIY